MEPGPTPLTRGTVHAAPNRAADHLPMCVRQACLARESREAQRLRVMRSPFADTPGPRYVHVGGYLRTEPEPGLLAERARISVPACRRIADCERLALGYRSVPPVHRCPSSVRLPTPGGRSHRGIMWVIEDHLRPSGHIMPDHVGDRGAVRQILEPREHLHINQLRMASGGA
jgi:hypothetical protein